MTKLSVFFAIMRKRLKLVCNTTWISVSRQEFFLSYKTAKSKSVLRFCPQGQSGRGTKLTTHFHLIPRLITGATQRLTPLYAFTVEQRQIYVSDLLRFSLWTSRCICLYLTVVITQPQQNCLLRSIKHGYVFRPLRGHLQAIKSYQIKIPFGSLFLWLDLDHHTVAQLVEALRYTPEDRSLDSRRGHLNF
jgi:hypothetical protein